MVFERNEERMEFKISVNGKILEQVVVRSMFSRDEKYVMKIKWLIFFNMVYRTVERVYIKKIKVLKRGEHFPLTYKHLRSLISIYNKTVKIFCLYI